MAQEAGLGLGQVDALGRLKQLNNRPVALYFKNLAATDFAAGQLDLAQLVIGDAFHMLNHHQRAGDLFYGLILFNHASSPPAITFAISSFICASMAS